MDPRRGFQLGVNGRPALWTPTANRLLGQQQNLEAHARPAMEWPALNTVWRPGNPLLIANALNSMPRVREFRRSPTNFSGRPSRPQPFPFW